MKPSIKLQFSSGGVIFRKKDGTIEIALIATKEGSVWALPKGTVDKREKPQETAVREVMEETGLKGRIIGKIGDIRYWYFLKEENARVNKTVSYYLLQYESGRVENHDWEVDSAEWFPIDEAARRVTYKGDREIIQKAKSMIEEING